MKTLLTFGLLVCTLIVGAQVSFEEIVEDKSDMADSYYGTFKYQGKAYTGAAIAYHSNGKIKTLRNFKDGRYHGMWTEWYANGSRKFQGDRVENKGQGLTKWWYENGNLKKQGTYDLDVQEGVVLYWHPNGKMKKVAHYKAGELIIPVVEFNEEGHPISSNN